MLRDHVQLNARFQGTFRELSENFPKRRRIMLGGSQGSSLRLWKAKFLGSSWEAPREVPGKFAGSSRGMLWKAKLPRSSRRLWKAKFPESSLRLWKAKFLRSSQEVHFDCEKRSSWEVPGNFPGCSLRFDCEERSENFFIFSEMVMSVVNCKIIFCVDFIADYNEWFVSLAIWRKIR